MKISIKNLPWQLKARKISELWCSSISQPLENRAKIYQVYKTIASLHISGSLKLLYCHSMFLLMGCYNVRKWQWQSSLPESWCACGSSLHQDPLRWLALSWQPMRVNGVESGMDRRGSFPSGGARGRWGLHVCPLNSQTLASRDTQRRCMNSPDTYSAIINKILTHLCVHVLHVFQVWQAGQLFPLYQSERTCLWLSPRTVWT